MCELHKVINLNVTSGNSIAIGGILTNGWLERNGSSTAQLLEY